MHLHSLRTIAFSLTALIGTTSAVSLASFIPRIDSLPSQCASVYNSQIDGCKAEDFGPKAICSPACVQGLNKITTAVGKSCAGVDVGETSIIGVFQLGLGIASLCPNTPVTSAAPSPSPVKTTTEAKTNTQAASSTTVPVAVTSPASSASPSATSETQSSSTSSEGVSADPSATTPPATSTVNTPQIETATNSPVANPSRAPNSQLSNTDSGGGSPFDVVAVGSSSQLQSSQSSAVALIATAILFLICI